MILGYSMSVITKTDLVCNSHYQNTCSIDIVTPKCYNITVTIRKYPLNVRLTKELVEALKHQSVSEGRRINAVVEDSIRMYLTKQYTEKENIQHDNG